MNYIGQSNEVKFNDNSNLPSEIQLMKAGVFSDGFRKFKINSDFFTKAKENFDKKVRKVDLAIDLSHDNHKDAAAWVRDLYVRGDGQELWCSVDWTKLGTEKVKSRQFRYTSAEFSFNYVDNETGEKYGPTLFGGALTNRPFIKDMKPVVLSEGSINTEENDFEEYVLNDETDNKEDEKMPKEMKEQLEENQKQLSELKKAQEKQNELVKSLSEQNTKLQEDAKKALEEKAILEKEAKFNEMFSKGQVCEAQRKPYLDGDFDAFAENKKDFKTNKDGHGENAPETFDDAQTEIDSKANELMEKNKNLTYSEAITSVMKTSPELTKKYNEKGV